MGVISTLSATHLVGDLQMLRASAPELDLDIRESHGEDLGEALEKGEIDVAIMTLSDCPDTLRAIPLYREPYRIAFAPRHRFCRMNAVPMRELMPRHLPLTSGLETRPVVEPEVHRTVSIDAGGAAALEAGGAGAADGEPLRVGRGGVRGDERLRVSGRAPSGTKTPPCEAASLRWEGVRGRLSSRPSS